MINWEQLDPRRTERGIQALLRNLYPGLRSLDGAGGDGGRDAQLVTADGRIVFEIKSFGRLNSSRRRQTENSLKAAVASVPDMRTWVLVVPMNMTPVRSGSRSSEEAWFDDRLSKMAPGVELEWRGQDWLDEKMAENNAIQRYIEGADSQLLQRAKEFDKERAVLASGLNDLKERINGLKHRVDEISPYWTLDFFTKGGVSGTVLRAKVPDAALVDPIRLTPTIAFRKNDPDADALRAQFERAIDFGGEVVLPAGFVIDLQIEASPEARLLLSDRSPIDSEFTFVTSRRSIDPPRRGAYQVREPDGRIVAQIPTFIREATSGSLGATLFAADAAGIASFEVRIPRPNFDGGPARQIEGAEVHLSLPSSLVGYDVDSLHALYSVLVAATAGRLLAFDVPGLGLVSGRLNTTAFPDAGDLLEFLDDLRVLQTEYGTSYTMPAAVSIADVSDLRILVRQIRGESPEFLEHLSMDLRPEKLGEFLQSWTSAPAPGPGGMIFATDRLRLTIGSLDVPYGPAAIWAPRPRLSNLDELLALEAAGLATDGRRITAHFEPTEHPFTWYPREQAREYLRN